MGTHWMSGIADSWTRQDWTGRADDAARIDPYLVWADATQFVDLGHPPAPAHRVRVMIELVDQHPPQGAENAQQFARMVETQDWGGWLQVSPLYLNPPAELVQTRFLTAVVKKRFFAELDGLLKGIVARVQLGLPVVPDDAVVPVPEVSHPFDPDRPLAPLAGVDERCHPVFMGVIDDGLAFAHQRFREVDTDEPSTRIECFWDQGPPGIPTDAVYGREFLKRDIDRLMKQCLHGGLVDEDALYREAEYMSVRHRWAHGTQIMDLACGAKPAEAPQAAGAQAPQPTHHAHGADGAKEVGEPHIICVQFHPPGRTIRDTSGLWFGVYALDALRYILHRANQLARGPCPVIVNLSYGYIAGPHDGSSMIEDAIDELIERHPDLSIVIPAGNSNLARCHAEFLLERDKSHTLNWRTLPDDATPSFLEVWLPPNADAGQVEIEITTPRGDKSPSIRLNEVHTWKPAGDVLCTVVYLRRVASGNRQMILVALAPTTTHDPERDTADVGMWMIRVTNSGKFDLPVHAWIQRDETAYGYPLRGRQTRFEDCRYRRFDRWGHEKDTDDGNENSWVKRKGTINSVATGQYTVVVAGFRGSDGEAARYSATGPGVEPGPLGKPLRKGPDAAAVSDDSAACFGVLGAGTRSRSVVAMDGTSVAGPQIARMLAKEKLRQMHSRCIAGEPAVLTAHSVTDHEWARNWVESRAAKDERARPEKHETNAGQGPSPHAVPHADNTGLPDERAGAGRIPPPAGDNIKRLDFDT